MDAIDVFDDTGSGSAAARCIRSFPLLLVVLVSVLLAACGGAPTLESAVAEGLAVAPVEPAATPTAVPSPVATAPPQATPTADANPLSVHDAMFCEAGRAVAELVEVGDFFADGVRAESVEAWAEAVSFQAEAAILLAPNDELAGPPNSFWVAWEELRVAFPPDGTFADFGTGPEVASARETVAEVVDQLEGYLLGVCGYDVADLEGNASGLAVQYVELAPVGWTGPTRDIEPRVGISMSAPAAWDDVRVRGTDGRAIVVSPSFDAYFESWHAEGASILVYDVLAGTADPSRFVGGAPAFTDCSLVGSEVYDDGLYFGTVTFFEACGTAETSAVVLMATDAGETVEILLEAQVPTGHEGIFWVILDSFVV